ncbi:hypothetical protein E2C01_044676 [Portunus trituberculatus]|uniref:Uncharacterized protein n=1 Tax=Portunus trituberculatus TaxID=210409 RepID=A0A5B7FSR2_PORTR|nr:hypothetical protein [Portunus trituberculatus]
MYNTDGAAEPCPGVWECCGCGCGWRRRVLPGAGRRGPPRVACQALPLTTETPEVREAIHSIQIILAVRKCINFG